jgi:dTDP-4-amino-4,6-dideoxygalactose transaminase
MLNVSLDHFETAQCRRNEIAEMYLSALSGVERISLPRVRAGTVPNWHKFVIRHSDRDALREHMSIHAVETQVHYARILPDATVFNGMCGDQFSNARRLSQSSLTLPLHAQMTDGEVEQVIDALIRFDSR